VLGRLLEFGIGLLVALSRLLGLLLSRGHLAGFLGFPGLDRILGLVLGRLARVALAAGVHRAAVARALTFLVVQLLRDDDRLARGLARGSGLLVAESTGQPGLVVIPADVTAQASDVDAVDGAEGDPVGRNREPVAEIEVLTLVDLHRRHDGQTELRILGQAEREQLDPGRDATQIAVTVQAQDDRFRAGDLLDRLAEPVAEAEHDSALGQLAALQDRCQQLGRLVLVGAQLVRDLGHDGLAQPVRMAVLGIVTGQGPGTPDTGDPVGVLDDLVPARHQVLGVRVHDHIGQTDEHTVLGHDREAKLSVVLDHGLVDRGEATDRVLAHPRQTVQLELEADSSNDRVQVLAPAQRVVTLVGAERVGRGLDIHLTGRNQLLLLGGSDVDRADAALFERLQRDHLLQESSSVGGDGHVGTVLVAVVAIRRHQDTLQIWAQWPGYFGLDSPEKVCGTICHRSEDRR